jgi:hypothetical protein
VEVRTSPDGGYDGSEVVGAADVGSGSGDPVVVHLPEEVEASHLLLWFTALPQTGTGYSAQVAEVSVR